MSLDPDCIFCKIISKKIPAKIVYEDEFAAAFEDLNPQAPVHILVVPKKHITEFYTLTDADKEYEKDMEQTLRKMIEKFDLMNKGYRITTNGGGAQAIDHFHLHLLGKITRDRKI